MGLNALAKSEGDFRAGLTSALVKVKLATS